MPPEPLIAGEAEPAEPRDVGRVGRGSIDQGDTRELVEGALAIARARLNMEIAWLAEFSEDLKVFRVVEGDRDGWDLHDDSYIPGADSYCQRMLDGRLPNAVPDALEHPVAKDLEITGRLGIRGYIGVPLVLGSGDVYGAFCASSKTPSQGLDDRDVAFMKVISRLVAGQLDLRDAERAAAGLRARSEVARALVAAIESRDSYTGAHSTAVVALAGRVARRLGLDGGDLDRVELVALLHDVGKLAIPDAILRKPGPLDAAEFEVVKRHPIEGALIVESVEVLAPLAPDIRAEHERWDGDGYPDGLAADAIPLASRITFVCDAFDAMTSARPYRPPLSLGEAIQELERGSGSQFWPEAVAALLAEMGPGPPEQPE